MSATKEYLKEWRKQNKEHIKQYHKEWRIQNRKLYKQYYLIHLNCIFSLL